MPFKYGQPVGAETSNAIALAKLEVPGGLLLTQCSGGSIDVAAAGAADTVTSITVDGTEVLGSTITYATSVANYMRLIQRAINAYSGNTKVFATNDGTSKVLLWPLAAQTAAVTWAVATTETGFTATDVNFNTEQAYAAAVECNSEGEGADNVGTVMYRCSFDFSYLSALDSSAVTLSSALAAETDITTEDQICRVYMGRKGAHVLGAAAEKMTFATLGVAQGHISMFLRSAAAQALQVSHRIY